VQKNEWSTAKTLDKVAWSFGYRGHDVDELSGSVLRQPWRGELEEGRKPVAWGNRFRGSPRIEREQRQARGGFNGGESTAASSRFRRGGDEDYVASGPN